MKIDLVSSVTTLSIIAFPLYKSWKMGREKMGQKIYEKKK